MTRHRCSYCLASILLLIVCQSSSAGDWPQILGPDRNGIAQDEHLAQRWPATGPALLWEAAVGSGFAGPAISGETLVLFHREGPNDKLAAFDVKSGAPRWSTDFPSTFQPQIVEDDGPRAVPTIHGDSIYAYSAQGRLYCVDLKSGKKKWERKTHQDFNASGGYFGAGSAPLVEGSLVIVNVGGDKQQAGIVAFDKETGETAWSAVNDQASYSAPIAVTLRGTRHLLCITRLNLFSLDPANGQERFRTPFGQRGPTVNAALPVVNGDHALLTASYGIGAQWLELGAKSVDLVWTDDLLSSQYTTPIIHEGLVYGVDGRQDGGPATLKCFDPESRKVLWSKAGLQYSTLIAADDLLLIMQTDGKLRLARLTKAGYQELAAASLLTGTSRALPALSRGRLFVRNEKSLACFDLSQHDQ